MSSFIIVRDPPEKRSAYCTLLDQGAAGVEIHPDGEHGKRFDIKKCLECLGFTLADSQGTTAYGGVHRRRTQAVTVSLKPGLGDVVGRIGGEVLVAECKGGITNTTHAGQVSKLRRGLCEAVGLLISRPLKGERHIAVVPMTAVTRKVAERMRPRAIAACIEIALVDERGRIEFVVQPTPI